MQEKWLALTERHKQVRKRKDAELDECNVTRRIPDSPTVYTAKKTATHSIPIPEFEKLLVGHVVDLTVAIRVYPRFFATLNPCGIIMIPKLLAPKNAKTSKRKRREYSLGANFGVDPDWIKFVADNVGYAVGRWKDLRSTRLWCQEQRNIFLDLLKQMWSYRLLKRTGEEKVTPFWRSAESQAPRTRNTSPF